MNRNDKTKPSKKAARHQKNLDAIKPEKPSDIGDDAKRVEEIHFQQIWKMTMTQLSGMQE